MTQTEAMVVITVIVILLLLLVSALAYRPRQEARRIRCRNCLDQLARGMALYITQYGDDLWHPFPLGRGVYANDFNGAEWLASLYWVGVVPDPIYFICPSSADTNHDGRDLGASRAIAGRFGSQTVSYAAMHYRSMTDTHGNPVAAAIPADYPPDRPMASDDTQGTVNHGEHSGGGMCVLFFDSHVDFKTNTEIDLRAGVGAAGPPGGPKPLLWQLRN